MSEVPRLTGRRRCRIEPRRWGKPPLLVLQVQWTGLTTRWLGGWPDSDFRTGWRDARVEDLSEEDAA